MNFGICTRYKHHEATYAAIRFANQLRGQNIDVSLYALNYPTASNVDPYWDSRLVSDHLTSYTKWARRQTHILWTHVPHKEQFEWTRSAGIKTHLLTLWNENNNTANSSAELLHLLSRCSKLICPSIACYNLYRHALPNCWLLPWDCGNPLYTRVPTKPSQPRILLPLWDEACRRTEMTCIKMVLNALYFFKHVTLTVGYSRKTMNYAALRLLLKAKRCLKDRIVLEVDTPPHQRFAVYQQHDITVYPSHHENFGSVAIESMEMGTPVVTFSTQPLDEIVDNHSGICVACHPDQQAKADGSVVPDYQEMQLQLFDLLGDAATLSEKQQATSLRAKDRRALFERQCSILLKD